MHSDGLTVLILLVAVAGGGTCLGIAGFSSGRRAKIMIGVAVFLFIGACGYGVYYSDHAGDVHSAEARRIVKAITTGEGEIYASAGRYSGSIAEIGAANPELDQALSDEAEVTLRDLPVDGQSVAIEVVVSRGANGRSATVVLEDGEAGSVALAEAHK